ncbi:MAG: hypothetical protein WBS54_08730 [Acidobacteriota bacterium]
MRHDHPNRFLTEALGAALLAMALLAGPSLRAQEGWDPFKQATSQISRPNLLIVLDVSGSMAWSPVSDSIQPGVDSFGLPSLSWDGDYSYKTDLYTWTLQASNNPPCRIDMFKNALGNSVPIYGSVSSNSVLWTSPAITWPSSWPTPHAGYTYIGGGQWTSYNNQPPFGSRWGGVTWTAPDYSTSPPTDPTIDGWDPGLTPSTPPQDLVGISKNKVNWGLEIFSTDLPPNFNVGYGTAGYDGYGYNACVLQQVSADDTQSTQNANATAIEGYLKANSLGGLDAYNSTATSSALNLAKYSLNQTYTSNGGDPAAACGRFYGVVLVTDGASNTCNPSGSQQSCSSSAPTNWYRFPEGRTNELFVETSDPGGTDGSGCKTADKTPVPARTFVIGVSSSVMRCELNLDAFMGRTDASSPNGDAGMDIGKDKDASGNYRLPLNVPSNYSIPAGSPLTTGTTTATTNYQSVTSSCTSNCKDYAYFATSAGALHDAFVAIVGAAGAGDYSTGAPVVSSNLVNAGSIAYVSSVTYPAMQGHIYSYDEQVLTKPTLLWDAGQVLASRDLNPSSSTYSPRAILTWDPADPTTVINLCSTTWNKLPTSIKTLLGNDPNAFFFLQGYANAIAGGGNTYTPGPQRPWLLGPIINSTAAIVGAPQNWSGKSGLPSHVAFEQTYSANQPMLVVGSSDGMLHFFDVADGYEVLAILPPDQLPNQEKLYQNFASGDSSTTGEPKDPSKHIYGVASSPRFADVYLSDGNYHTVLLLTEGKGGRSLTGIDITHPYPGRTNVTVPYVTVVNGSPVLHTKTGVTYNADANYSTKTPPISVLWYKDGALASTYASSYPKLGQSWSVPAMGFTNGSGSTPIFSCILGGGFQSPTSYSDPQALQLNVADGSETGVKDLGNSTSGLVHNQAYGAGVLFDATAPSSRPNDLFDLGVVADTNGNVWSVSAANGTWSATALFSPGTSYPIYYTPAVGYYAGYDVYAYASGNFYEVSPNVTGPNFQARVFITLVDPTGAKSALTTYSDISNFTYTDSSGNTKNVPSTAQITSDPMLFLPANSVPSPTMPIKAYFTFYDPNPALGCGGASFLIKMSLDLTKVAGGTIPAEATTMTAAYLGSGASSGIAFSGGKIIVAKSALGTGSAAPQVTNENAPTTVNQAPGINAWQELQ